jgi:hypothetical protein
LPITVCLFDLGDPIISNGTEEGGGMIDGMPVYANDEKTIRKASKPIKDSNLSENRSITNPKF